MRSWRWRQWTTAAVGAMFTALLIGVPTAIIDTPFYTRMTPVTWWSYPAWAATAILSGLLFGTYVTPRDERPSEQRKLFASGLLSYLAVGCPVCNKLVVMALGVGGTLNYFAPAQPVLALMSLLLLTEALRRRLAGAVACPAPRRSEPPSTLAETETSP